MDEILSFDLSRHPFASGCKTNFNDHQQVFSYAVFALDLKPTLSNIHDCCRIKSIAGTFRRPLGSKSNRRTRRGEVSSVSY